MKYIFLLFVLSLSLTTQAQDKKNELQVGWPTTAYFFEGTPIKKILDIFPSYITYSRVLKKKIRISMGYRGIFLGNPRSDVVPNKDNPGDIYTRHMRLLQLKVGLKKLLKERLVLEFNSGLNYLYKGGELFSLGTYNHGGWAEGHVVGRNYTGLGISIGTQVKLSLIKNFNLGIGVEYTRFKLKYDPLDTRYNFQLPKISPNLLTTSLFIGYEFNLKKIKIRKKKKKD